MSNICILGGGISGLTLAYRLQSASRADITLGEVSSRLGGVVRTAQKNGYLLEYGPSSVLACNGLMRFAAEIGLESELVTAAPKLTRFIAKADRAGRLTLVPLPRDPVALCRTPLLTVAGKLRLFAEPVLPRSSVDDESIHDFFCRRLGPEFAEHFAAPIVSGIWAASARELSMRSSLNAVWRNEQEYRSLLFALIAKKFVAWSQGVGPGARTISFARGLERLPERLAELLGRTRVMTNRRFESRELVGYDKVFLASNATHCANVILESDPALAATINAVPSVPIGILHLGFRRAAVKHPLNGFGFLVPPIYRRVLRGAIFSSSIFPGRAPEGCHLLSCILSTDPENEGTRRAAFHELGELLGLTEEPEVLDSTFLPRALPTYPVGHHELQSKVDHFHQAQERISIVSSWFRGLSVAQRVQEALNAAERFGASGDELGYCHCALQ